MDGGGLTDWSGGEGAQRRDKSVQVRAMPCSAARGPRRGRMGASVKKSSNGVLGSSGAGVVLDVDSSSSAPPFLLLLFSLAPWLNVVTDMAPFMPFQVILVTE